MVRWCSADAAAESDSGDGGDTMKQTFLKASWGLGWGSHDYRIGLGGEGSTPYAETYGASFAKVVIPINGVFNNLAVYSPVGAHPNYTVTLMVNGVASSLTCALLSTASVATDRTHAVTVVAGNDIYFSVNVNPFGSGVGYPLNLSVEFEGAQQFYSVTPATGGVNAGVYATSGALGNGIQQTASVPNQLSNTYSICTTPGTLTGIGMKFYGTAPNTGGSWIGYITKNQVLQDGSGGTVNTACTLADGLVSTTNAFALPVAVGDRVDFALLRTGTNAVYNLVSVGLSSLFTPTDSNSFMCCGGNNDANVGANATDYKWVQSEQQIAIEEIAQCPIGPRGITVNGLRIELPIAPGPGLSRVFTIRKSGVDTAATVTIAGTSTAGVMSGLNIPFIDGDYIDLQIVNVGNPSTLNGLKWGLSLAGPWTDPPSYHLDERPIRRLRRAPHLAQENTRVFYRKFELDLARGVGLATGQGADPLFMLRLSRDGGHTWGEPLTMSAGALGAYTQHVIARRLGQARDTVFEATVSAPVAWSLVNAWLDLEPGTSECAT